MIFILSSFFAGRRWFIQNSGQLVWTKVERTKKVSREVQITVNENNTKTQKTACK
jgi:hypothetical protein